jgi:hypothetical protein
MSHHLDCQLARRDSRLDITDLFVFRGEIGTVLIMDVNTSLAGPDGAQPGFNPEARYEFKIHLDGADEEGLCYRVTFGGRGYNGEQPVAVRVLTGSEARDDTADGELLVEGVTHSDMSGPNGLRAWAGRARDPFYVDLTLVRAVNAAVKNGARIELPGWSPGTAKSDFASETVHSIVLEIADRELGAGRRLGVWASSKLPTDAGGWQQVNREGHPMIWPIFRPDDSAYASDANRLRPVDEVEAESKHLAELIAAVVSANGTAADPMACGEAVVRRLLPDILPYQVDTPAVYGFADHNGRGLADNAPEAMFSLVLNMGIDTGLAPAQFAGTRSSRFPYVVTEPADI